MSKSKIRITGLALILMTSAMIMVTEALARSDETIRREIAKQFTESDKLRDTKIQINVEQRLVVLSGEVQFYEQKLLSERIAWTTPDVFEVDNEIQVKPKLPLSDIAIEQKVRQIVKANERYRAAAVLVMVSNGKVFLEGSFLGFSDPSTLKHKIAEIEGVVDIEINAIFLA